MLKIGSELIYCLFFFLSVLLSWKMNNCPAIVSHTNCGDEPVEQYFVTVPQTYYKELQ